MLSFLMWEVSLSSLRSRVRVSKRVWAVSAGFFHLLWTKVLNGPNGIGEFAGEGGESAVLWGFLNSRALMAY